MNNYKRKPQPIEDRTEHQRRIEEELQKFKEQGGKIKRVTWKEYDYGVRKFSRFRRRKDLLPPGLMPKVKSG